MTTHVCQIEKLKNYKIRSVKCHRIGSVSFQLIYASFHLKVNRKAIQRYSTVSTFYCLKWENSNISFRIELKWDKNDCTLFGCRGPEEEPGQRQHLWSLGSIYQQLRTQIFHQHIGVSKWDFHLRRNKILFGWSNCNWSSHVWLCIEGQWL